MIALTHYAFWDAPGRRYVRALCGVSIKRTEHANNPTCTICRVCLAGRMALDERIAEDIALENERHERAKNNGA